MKFIYSLIFACYAISSVAQNNNKVKIRLTQPVTGSIIISNQPTDFHFWIRNIDTVPIQNTGKVAVTVKLIHSTRSFQTAPIILSGISISPGDSQPFIETLKIIDSIPVTNLKIEFAVWWIDGNDTTLNDTSSTFVNLYLSLFEDQVTTNSLQVYPNPASNNINFKLDYENAKSIYIYSSTGVLVDVIRNNEKLNVINVAHYTKGIYLYEVKTEEGVLIRKGKFIITE